ncbi:HlyD family secretion protein [Pseudoalteromonas ulvae UL12]|uniref:efflux RND transporter periplasmic adaptor subunit n=1 Tax=Pseudoalteromonas ulvae TaxID=107327 RepID=UPI00186B6036|nr:HlyD family efflux transporter periplasmic adaptor subunit [Pseudoalteromonas ulvae]MBE0363510.1 HlyD family secretion protein [Pseudoalteromonas ulvae UL12]
MIKDTRSQDTVIVQSKRKTKRYGLAALLVISASGLAWAGLNAAPSELSIDSNRVQLAKVERGNLTRDVSATGRIVAANAPQVYSPEQGYVDLLVQPGDKVTKDQVIAKVASPELNNNLKQQESVLQRLRGELERQKLDARRKSLSLTKTLDLAQVELTAAERENRRAELSIKKSLISQIDLEAAVDNLSRAQLSFAHAKQEVALAKDTLAFEFRSAKSDVERQQLVVDELTRQVRNLAIKAPVAGIVGNHLVQQKSAVSASQALMTLVDLSAFEAELQVPESYANELGLGMSVELSVGAKNIIGTLSAISPEVSGREVTTRVRFSGQESQSLRQNQRVTARILLENRENVLMVKRGAFMQQGGFVAYKVEDDIASRIEIAIGATSIAAVEINKGVQEGDTLIVSSYEQFDNAEHILLR